MFRKIIFILSLFLVVALNAQTPFTVFDFEGDTMNPAQGTGTLTLIGGVGSSYVTGWTGTGTGGRALNTNAYPAASSNPETAGINIQVSTSGYSNIQISWNHRHSNTAANRIRLQYTLDGSSWINFDANEANATNVKLMTDPAGFDNGLFVATAGDAWYLRTADFSAITGANNNSSFAVRFVTAFPSGANAYSPSTDGQNYAVTGTQRYDNITFSHIDSNTVLPPVANPAGGTYSSAINVSLTTATENADIYYTTDGNDPSAQTGTLYTAPISLSENTTLKFRAEKAGMTPSAVVNEVYVFPIQINTLAQLRQHQPGNNNLYVIVNEVLVTYAQSFRGQKFIQDQTAAILIDDYNGIITTQYQIGDGITGLTGTMSEFGGMLQFIPNADPGQPSSTGNTILPNVITMQDFINNFDTYESQLVAIQNISFTAASGNFAVGTVYPLNDGSNTINFRTSFYDADYIGQEVPSDQLSMIGILTERADGRFITSRYSNDFRPTYESDMVVSFNHRLIGNYPNPFNPSTTIAFELKSNSLVDISVFNVKGQKVKTLVNQEMSSGNHTVNWNGTDENSNEVSSGVYYYRMSTPDFVQIKRAILVK